ncbi:MAG: hypothetical protein IPO64_11935 [Bacteroidetes bacterium]|nr:hypothetical protein [Bacteroidota bacterium]
MNEDFIKAERRVSDKFALLEEEDLEYWLQGKDERWARPWRKVIIQVLLI